MKPLQSVFGEEIRKTFKPDVTTPAVSRQPQPQTGPLYAPAGPFGSMYIRRSLSGLGRHLGKGGYMWLWILLLILVVAIFGVGVFIRWFIYIALALLIIWVVVLVIRMRR